MDLADHNGQQRDRIGRLGLEALDLIDSIEGEHMIADALLIVEVVRAEDHRTDTYTISTTDRLTVQRGIIEQARDGMIDAGWAVSEG